MSTQLCSTYTVNCPLAEFTDGLCDLEGVSCIAYLKAREALTKYFKFVDFRPGQLAALMPVLHGRDVLVKMATGAGKSLCIDLVPLVMGPRAVGVVVSPLNGLMDQQVCKFANLVSLLELTINPGRSKLSILGTTNERCWNTCFKS